jgi:flagellar basal-body rod protein FlgG
MYEPVWGAGRALSSYTTKLAVIANNLANVSTPGFIPHRAVFEEMLAELRARPPGFLVATGSSLDPTLRAPGLQGAMVPTGRRWDLALSGPGYFVVQMADGRMAYTRSGAFAVDAQRRLVGPQGSVVMREGNVPLDPQAGDVPAIRAFANLAGLYHLGHGLYAATEASGPPLPAPPGTRVLAGHLESSTVDLATEMAAMLTAQRAFQLASRGLDIHDQMLGLANRLRGG